MSSCSSRATLLEEVKHIPYPSASAVEYHNRQLFVMGDDATHLLILDSNFNLLDSVQFFTHDGRRIPKDIKPDLEAMASIRHRDSLQLLLVGSGSSPARNTIWIMNPSTKEKTEWKIDTFYRRLKNLLPELNIEGACYFGGSVVLSNRGHKDFPRNHLVFTSANFWHDQNRCPLNLVKVGVNEDSANFQGVSGLSYARRSDKLILAVSTEDTRSVYEDGAIGKSYLWIIDNISTKRRWKAINPNRIIDLEETDIRFRGQKIESVCVIKETRNFLHLVLVADNDDGSSKLFKLIVEKQ